jgi:hypothetical protein
MTCKQYEQWRKTWPILSASDADTINNLPAFAGSVTEGMDWLDMWTATKAWDWAIEALVAVRLASLDEANRLVIEAQKQEKEHGGFYYLKPGYQYGEDVWWVMDGRGDSTQEVACYHIRLQAQKLIDALRGNKEAAKQWYYMEFDMMYKLAIKKGFPIGNALMHAAAVAARLGLSATTVGAITTEERVCWAKRKNL